MRVTVLAGGVGAARFLRGLVRVVEPAEVTIVCNVSDDFEWHGLYVSPDIDTVIYTLAALEGEFGWGVRGDTRAMLDELATLGEEPWFQIGDRDLATHIWRTERLRAGQPLSTVTAALAQARGLGCAVLPVTDDQHPTVVETEEGALSFQDYFVRRRARDHVRGFRFPGAATARPAPGVIEALDMADAIVIAPSNPFVSIGPVLKVARVQDALVRARARSVAVSPIVGGSAVKGPAADMLRALGHEVSALGVARLYAGLIDHCVIDLVDAELRPAIEALGMRVQVTNTMMTDEEKQTQLAHDVLAAVSQR